MRACTGPAGIWTHKHTSTHAHTAMHECTRTRASKSAECGVWNPARRSVSGTSAFTGVGPWSI